MPLKKSISKTLLLLGITQLFFLHFLNAGTNQDKIDSLQNELHLNKNDSVLIDINLKLGKEWERKNLDTALSYFNRAMEISQKNNWPGRMAQTNVNIAFAYHYNRKPDLVIEYLKKGLELYKEADEKVNIMNTEYNLGYFYGTYEQFPEAIQQFKKVISLAIELKHDKRLSGAYNNIGLMYNYSGLFEKANEYQFKSLEIGEKIGENMAYTHLNIALNYSEYENHRKSLEHNKIAARLFKEMGNESYIAQGLKAMGDNYSNMYILDSAEYYYHKSYEIFKKLNDQQSIARYHMVIGIISDKRGLYKKAEKQYKLALKTIPEDRSRKLRFAIHSNLAKMYSSWVDKNMGDNYDLLNKVISYSKLMLKTAKEFEAIDMQTEAYEHLYKAYEKMGNSKSALAYANEYILMKDSLFSEQKQKAIAEMQTKYETEKKELEIQVLNSENELISTKLDQSQELQKKQRTIIIILIAGFLIVGVLLLIILKYYRQTKSKNRQLIEQNTVILKQKEEKEILVKEIHHRTKNNLQIISSLFDMQMRTTDNPDTKAALIDGLNRIKSVGLIHQLLYQSEDVININFREFVKKLMDHITSFSSDKPINQNMQIPEDIQFDIETTLPLGLIINELLTNSFKYAFQEVESCDVSVVLNKTADNNYQLEIKDNGLGLPPEFDFRTSKSLGLRLVRTLAEQLSGKIEYKLENGAKFLVTFKK